MDYYANPLGLKNPRVALLNGTPCVFIEGASASHSRVAIRLAIVTASMLIYGSKIAPFDLGQFQKQLLQAAQPIKAELLPKSAWREPLDLRFEEKDLEALLLVLDVLLAVRFESHTLDLAAVGHRS